MTGGCIPLIKGLAGVYLLVDVCQCCRLLKFVCLPLFKNCCESV